MKRQVTASTCCYCGVGCGVLIEHDGTQIFGVSGDPAHPANFGKLCSKGSSLHLTGDLTARALYPQLRLGKELARGRTDWDTALEHATNVFADTIAEHGPDSVAFYISGQLLTEDYYSFNKLARALVGTNNIDSNSRLCMSSAVVGYKRSLGADAPPCSYEDLEASDCVMIVGSNMAYAHPVLFRRLEEAKARRPEMKVLVIDPRRTDTCDLADMHLAILPGTDVALFHGILHLLLWEDWIDRDFIQAHTEGLVELKRLVHDYTPQMVTQLCGISVEQLRRCAQWVGTSPSFLSLWCMGLNQSTAGSAKNSALINLHLATGTIGRPGCGPFSLTGQPNAMGGRETGSLSNLLPGHRDAGNAEHRAEVAAYWGVEQLPCSTGLTAIELFEQVQAGKIKALWIACTNPAQSLPDQNNVRQALAACPFVVLQEAFRTTETAAFADLPDLQLLNSIDRLLGLNDGPVMAYDDPRRSIGKRVKIEKGRITAIRLAGETLARHWLQSLWLEGRADEQLRRWLLAPLSAPPGGGTTSNRILCDCKNVSESAICAGIGRGLNLDGLKQALGCGTQCGSCVPEIKRLLASTSQPIAISV